MVDDTAMRDPESVSPAPSRSARKAAMATGSAAQSSAGETQAMRRATSATTAAGGIDAAKPAAIDAVNRGLTDAARVRAELVARLAGCDALRALHVFDALPSTNAWLAERESPPPGRCDAALALHQTAGRGRRGKTWTAPPGSGLCLSIAYCYTEMPPVPSALSLALGVAAAGALESLGVDAVALKWPNDLVWRDGKLGGLLVETSHSRGRFVVVAGIGVNVRLPADFQLDDCQPGWSRGPADLAAAGVDASIADVAAAMIPAFAAELRRFGDAGFAPLADAYNRRNWLADRDALIDGERVRCAGVDSEGRLGTDRGPVSSGEIMPLDTTETRA